MKSRYFQSEFDPSKRHTSVEKYLLCLARQLNYVLVKLVQHVYPLTKLRLNNTFSKRNWFEQTIALSVSVSLARSLYLLTSSFARTSLAMHTGFWLNINYNPCKIKFSSTSSFSLFLPLSLSCVKVFQSLQSLFINQSNYGGWDRVTDRENVSAVTIDRNAGNTTYRKPCQ